MTTVPSLTDRFRISVLLVTSLILVAVPTTGLAQEADPPDQVAFGIRPVSANDQVPESYSYFVHTLDPGATLSDEVMVLNEGTAPVSLSLYVADAATAINGGTAFGNAISTSEAASWVTLNTTRVSLQPGEERIVSFTIDLPSEASPGEHITGIVVEAEPTVEQGRTEGEGTQFGVEVVRRAGVAVVVEVPGPPVIGLAVSDLKIRELNEEGALLSYTVTNTGTVMLHGSGVITVTNSAGSEVAAITFDMGTVLPGDTGLFLIPYPQDLEDGEYQLWLTLDYIPVLAGRPTETITFGPIDVSIVDGQPAGASAVLYPELQPSTPNASPSSEQSSNQSPILLIAAAIAAAVLIGAIALLIREGRGIRRRHPYPTRPPERSQQPRDST